MNPEQLLITLQLSDSLFPTGGFAYSDGLETAVNQQRVKSETDLTQWMNHYIDAVFEPCDGLAVRRAMLALRADRWNELAELDRELSALKPSGGVRFSSVSIGGRLLKSVQVVSKHVNLERLTAELERGTMRGNLPVVYGIVVESLGHHTRDALLAFAYTRLAGISSAALRLMAIGQGQAQASLRSALTRVPDAVERVLQNDDGRPTSFTPCLDIQQMNHRFVYSRLFRS